MVIAKIAQTLFSPLAFSLALFLLASLIQTKWRKLARSFQYSAVALLLLFSNRWVANLLIRSIEVDFPPRNYASVPEVDFVIVLGGTITPTVSGHINLEETGGNRLVPAVLLYKAGKVKKILVSGGNPYRRDIDGNVRTEASDMADYLEGFGIPNRDILKEDRSRNTEENAREVARLLRDKKGKKLLLTSAFHMKRAAYLFNRAGVEAIPFAVAHRAYNDYRFWYLNLIPTVQALDMSSVAIKEYLGLLWGMLRGGG